ncbi:urease accessory protein UreD [Dongia rigui]|uniref:Urease accessory protein UreD n=1 Tax=Dongia rigui TaxID=940149 RepID=A0ABU5E011_9PROT|nr:urease accessory protein UreD [Dongia rigui]MDY0872602.1 urease accessory protein UreD [Dongia rigui]
MSKKGMAVEGSLDIRFAGKSPAETRLVHLDQRAPLRALFPHCPDMGLPVTAITATCGGFTGGDHLTMSVDVAAGAGVMAVGQAAEKLYRSTGAETRIDINLSVGADGWLEWLPQETILFDGARLRRRTSLAMATGSAMLGGEILVFGRQARGEHLTHGLVHDGWQLARDGKPAWADIFHAADQDLTAMLAHPAALAGARASAMLVHVGADLGAALAWVRERLALANNALRAAATIVNDVLLVRWLADDASDIRPSFAALWMGLRGRARNLPANLPTFWHA